MTTAAAAHMLANYNCLPWNFSSWHNNNNNNEKKALLSETVFLWIVSCSFSDLHIAVCCSEKQHARPCTRTHAKPSLCSRQTDVEARFSVLQLALKRPHKRKRQTVKLLSTVVRSVLFCFSFCAHSDMTKQLTVQLGVIKTNFPVLQFRPGGNTHAMKFFLLYQWH